MTDSSRFTVEFVDMLLTRIDALERRCDDLQTIADTVVRTIARNDRSDHCREISADAWGLPGATLRLCGSFDADETQSFWISMHVDDGRSLASRLDAPLDMLCHPVWLADDQAVEYARWVSTCLGDDLIHEMQTAYDEKLRLEDVDPDVEPDGWSEFNDTFLAKMPSTVPVLGHTCVDSALAAGFLASKTLLANVRHIGYVFDDMLCDEYIRMIVETSLCDLRVDLLGICKAIGLECIISVEMVPLRNCAGIVDMLKIAQDMAPPFPKDVRARLIDVMGGMNDRDRNEAMKWIDMVADHMGDRRRTHWLHVFAMEVIHIWRMP
jgi:hypothetical protein